MGKVLITLAIGFVAGYFSGQFGIGGGLITTPGIRIILGQSPLIALGTPLPVIIPSALAGLYNYWKKGLVDFKLGLDLSFFGIVGVIFGALSTKYISGHYLMLSTAAVIFFLSFRFFLLARSSGFDLRITIKKGSYRIIVPIIGLSIGFFSGLLGLGGGFLLIPALTIFFNKDIKQAFGASLFVIVFYSIPGSITHFFLHHIDLKIMLLLMISTIPGAFLGSKVAIKMSNKLLNILFGFFLILTSVYFAYFEIFSISR